MLCTIKVKPDNSLIDEVKKLPDNATSILFESTWTNYGKYTLGNKTEKEVSEAFKCLPKTVRKIDCKGNELGYRPLAYLKGIFSALDNSITYLNLSYNKLHVVFAHPGLREDLSLLGSLPSSLNTLDLSHNNFEVNSLQHGIAYLHRNVINLNLSHNKLEYDGVIKVLDWLKTKSIKQLDITHNSLVIPTDSEWINLWKKLPPSIEQLLLGREPMINITCTATQVDKPILSNLKHLAVINVNPFNAFNLTKWIPFLPQNLTSLNLRFSLANLDATSLSKLFETLPKSLRLLSIESNSLEVYFSAELEQAFSKLSQDIVDLNLKCTGIFYKRSGTELQKIFSPLQQVRILHLNGFETLSSKDIKQLKGVFPSLQTLYLDESDLEMLDNKELDAFHQAFSHVPTVTVTPSSSSSIYTQDKQAMANLTRKYGFKAPIASLVDYTSFFIASHPKIKTMDQKGQKFLTAGMDELVEGIKNRL